MLSGDSSPSLSLTLLLAVVFPQDLLEKGLDADNFAMLGLGDIVIPGEDRSGGTGLGSPSRGLRGAGQVPRSALGGLPGGWESPRRPGSLSRGCPGSVAAPCATRGHCHPGHGSAAGPALPPSAPHCFLLPAGIFIALLLRFDIR